MQPDHPAVWMVEVSGGQARKTDSFVTLMLPPVSARRTLALPRSLAADRAGQQLTVRTNAAGDQRADWDVGPGPAAERSGQ
jgi:hypothetical protein